jgi:hypothetical protein
MKILGWIGDTPQDPSPLRFSYTVCHRNVT